MGKFGDIAVKSTFCIHNGITKNPIDAWNKTALKLLAEGSSSLNKGCPRNAFLGLCEEGYIKGVPLGKYTKSRKNKQYAVNTVKQLFKNPLLAEDKEQLWELVTGGITHNQQMDVVISLWNANLIVGRYHG
jgi:hypothetical protein